MFQDTRAFSSFAVDDLARAKEFYGQTLGLAVSDVPQMAGLLTLELAGGHQVMVYEKSDHAPAAFTILKFLVPDVDAAVDELSGRGVSFQRYDGFDQDEKGIARGMGPSVAWFTDPAGNILALVEQGPDAPTG